ncbi:leucine-rich repeat, cysteine-containing subtype protein [Tanacetum coccineum]
MKTNVGEVVLDLVIPYIHNVDDRNSVSLVSRKFYEIDGITRKCVSVQAYYYPNPASLSKRFPFIESLTLKGPPYLFNDRDGYVIRIAPWIQQLALEFRFLKELHVRNLVVCDEDLETLARTRGKDLRSLKIKRCEGYSSDGLRHVSKYCNQLRTLCLGLSYDIDMNDGIWLHELALNSTVLERLHVGNTDVSYAEYLTLLAKNCCNSLKSLKIGECCLSKLGDAFRYAVRLEHFGGYNRDEESDLVGFNFPQNMCSITIADSPVTRCSIVLPFLNHIRKLKLVYFDMDAECQCLLFKRCPNLEVLYTEDLCGDKGLQVIGQFCKKLRKLNHFGFATGRGLIALAKGCTNLECLEVRLSDVSNEAIEFVGTHLKNLRKFRMYLVKKDGTTDLPLDNGIQAMLIGCNSLEKLDMCRSGNLLHGGLTDVGLEYIGKYGRNLRNLSLTCIGKSDAGLVMLSKGCPKLRKLKLIDCPFSKQAVTSFVFNMPSLRDVYVWFDGSDPTALGLIRPEFQL